MKKIIFLFFILLFSSSYAEPRSKTPSSLIKASHFWVALAPPIATTTVAYSTLENAENLLDKLLGVTSGSGMAMLHQTSLNNGMAKMNHRPKMTIAPTGSLNLGPCLFMLC